MVIVMMDCDYVYFDLVISDITDEGNVEWSWIILISMADELSRLLLFSRCGQRLRGGLGVTNTPSTHPMPHGYISVRPRNILDVPR